MQLKKLTLFFVATFAILLAIGAVSATVNFVNTTGTAQSVSKGSTATVTFNVQETNVSALTVATFNTALNLSSGSNILSSASTVTGFSGTITQNSNTAMSLTFAVPAGQADGTYTGTLSLSGTYSGSPAAFTLPISITVAPSEIATCLTKGNIVGDGILRVRKLSFTNNGITSSYRTYGDSKKWFPFESVDSQIEIKNDGNESVNSIEVAWGIYDVTKNKWVTTPDTLKDFNLNKGKSKTINATFTIDNGMDLDLTDIRDSDTYKFYVTATGEVDTSVAPAVCATDSQSVSINIENDFAVLNSVQVPETVKCGATTQISANVWNVGSNDQNKVSVDAYEKSKTLGVSQNIQLGDIDSFSSKPLSLTFKVPSGIEEKTYFLTFDILNEDKNVFKTNNDDAATFMIPLVVKGNCAEVPQASIAATLQSAAKAGQPLVVKTTLKNSGDSLKTYSIATAEYAQWADSVSSDLNTVALNAGESKDVTFTFNVNKAASGAQTFFVEAVSGSAVTRQAVSVNIEPKTGIGSSLSDLISGGSSVWLISLLNVILIVIIIIVAVRVAKR